LGDGILFFLVAFVANALPAVFLLINLNPVMNIIWSIPAIALSASVACRSFVRLSEFAQPVERSMTSNHWSSRTGTTKRPEPGKTSTIQWARSPQTDTIGINVTRSQHVDVDIGMDSYRGGHNIHPLESHSGDSLDRKGSFAV
jgi:hypothetical protein